jgi:hypothetical protein
MAQDDRKGQLLTEILETQRAHLEEYKRVTSESLRLQRQGVETQARYIRLLRPFLIAGAVLIVGVLAYVLWLTRLIR